MGEMTGWWAGLSGQCLLLAVDTLPPPVKYVRRERRIDLTIHFFAAIAERVGETSVDLHLSAPDASVGTLRSHLKSVYPDSTELLDACFFAVEGKIARDQTPLRDSLNVDVLPPFAGG